MISIGIVTIMRTISLLFLILIPFFIFAQDNETVFSAANEDYTNGKFERAISKYQQLLSNGYVSPALHFNLGNSYYKRGDLGYAVLHFEKSLLLQPNDKDVVFNLEKANRKQVDEIIQIPSFFLSRWWNGIRKWMSSGMWTGIGLLLFWGGIAGIIYWLIGADRTKRKKAFLIGIFLTCFSLIPILLGRSSYINQTRNNFAVVTKKEAKFKISADIESETLLTIHEGLKVEIMDKIQDVFKIKLPNGDEGWVNASVIEKI